MTRSPPGKSIVTLGTFSLLCALASASMAGAAPATLHWSTYLRSGPGGAYPVLDEVEHDTVVDVQASQGRWRRVSLGRTVGWIDGDALSLPKPPAGATPARGAACFNAPAYSYSLTAPRRFCPDAHPATSR